MSVSLEDQQSFLVSNNWAPPTFGRERWVLTPDRYCWKDAHLSFIDGGQNGREADTTNRTPHGGTGALTTRRDSPLRRGRLKSDRIAEGARVR